MINLTALWLPILLSAVLAFIASSIAHMLLRHHRSDFSRLPDEDAGMEALRRLNIPTGNYMTPYAGSPEAMKQPEFKQKMKQGPLAILTVRPGGSMNMGSMLSQWFVYLLVVSLLSACVASGALPLGASYPAVFRIVSLTAFMAYAMGSPIESIWYCRKWSSTIKNMIDGLAYALLTGGVFGWLWPH